MDLILWQLVVEKTFERYYGEHYKMAFFYMDLCRCGSLAWGASELGHIDLASTSPPGNSRRRQR